MLEQDNVFQGANYRITVLTERLIRFEYNENSLFYDGFTEQVINRTFEKPELTVEQDEKRLIVNTKYFKLNYIKEKPFIGSKLAPFSNLEVKLNESDKSWYYNHPEARNFGSPVDFNKDGKPNITKGLYSTDGFASLDDSETLLLNPDGHIAIPQEKRVDIYLFMYKRDFGLCLKDYFTLTGAPPMIRRHALGVWWHRNEIYNHQDIRGLVQNFSKYKIPFTNLILGEYWHLKDKNDLTKLKTGYTFNRNLFEDPKTLIENLHEKGIFVGLQIDPTEGIMPHEDGYNYIAKDLGLQEQSTIPFNVFDKFILINYFKHLINPLKNLGVDFFWLDYNSTPENIQALNYYHSKNMEQDTTKRPLVLSKIGSAVPHRYPVHYSGETKVSWDYLKQLPYFNTLACNKGMSFWSHDVGGYKDGLEDSELYTRHVQFATFSPIFRFSSKKGHYYKREPWKWDAKTLSIATEYTNLRHKLIPYLYSESYKYHKYGTPLIKPLYYNTPFIYDEPRYKNEYYLGSELLISPITIQKDKDMNRVIENIYIPKGYWYDFKSGKKFLGNKRSVIFYKDEDYPVFAKNGAIIILRNSEEEINNVNNPKHLDVHIFPGESNNYILYEDDGITNLYKEGFYIKTSFDYNYLQNNYTLIIRPIEGKTGLIPEKRDYTIRFRNTRKSENVIVYLDSQEIVCDSYIEGNDFVIELEDIATTSQLTINCHGEDIEIDAIRIINEEIDSIISDLHLSTRLKEKISSVMFSQESIDKKRIKIRKLKKYGIDKRFIKMFLRLIEYAGEV